jgi:LmbE family N-acetylglucosaminyl deacetylase
MRPEGCIPDLGTVRSGEAGAASEYFGADSILLTYQDGGGSVAPVWDVNAGGSPDVIPMIANYIKAVAPEAVVTFDPRHGTTCHPDHRALGNIVADAVKQIDAPPQLYFLETRVTFDAQPFAVHLLPAITSAERFDANLQLGFTRGAAWNAISDDMQRHSSQFDGRWIAAIQNVPAAQRSVFLMPAAAAAQQPVSVPCP